MILRNATTRAFGFAGTLLIGTGFAQAFSEPRPIFSFPPEIVGERGASGGTYGRDSSEILFMTWPPVMPRMLVSVKGASGWGAPRPVLPDFPHLSLGPAVSPDGMDLYFESNHRDPAMEGRRDTDLWIADRGGDAWVRPRPIGSPFNSEHQEHNVTVSARRTICFNSTRPGGLGEHDIYCSQSNGAGWAAPSNLGPAVNSASVDGAAHLSADEEFIVFGSDRPGGFGGDDLYVSVRRDGKWHPAVNLGPAINSADGEWAPSVTKDGRRLLFTRIRGDGNSARFTLMEVSFNLREYQKPTEPK